MREISREHKFAADIHFVHRKAEFVTQAFVSRSLL